MRGKANVDLFFSSVKLEDVAWKILLQVMARFSIFCEEEHDICDLPWNIENVFVKCLPSSELSVFPLENSFWLKKKDQKHEKHEKNKSLDIPILVDDSFMIVCIEKNPPPFPIFLHHGHIFFHFLTSLRDLFHSSQSNYPDSHPMVKYVNFLIRKLPFTCSSRNIPCSFCNMIHMSNLPPSTFHDIKYWRASKEGESKDCTEDILGDLGMVFKYYTEEFSLLSKSLSVKTKLWEIMMNGLIHIEEIEYRNKNKNGNVVALAYLNVQQQILEEFPFMKFPSKLIMTKINSIRQTISKLWPCPEKSMWDLWFLTLLYRAPYVPLPSKEINNNKTIIIRSLFQEDKNEPLHIVQIDQKVFEFHHDKYELPTVTLHPCVRLLKRV
jgi:hypothetical protein